MFVKSVISCARLLDGIAENAERDSALGSARLAGTRGKLAFGAAAVIRYGSGGNMFGEIAGAFQDEFDKCSGRSRQRAISPVDESQLSKQIDILDGDELGFAGSNFVVRE